MAFKQKSGSPFQRNFGVGASPAKQTSPIKDTKYKADGKTVDTDADKKHKQDQLHNNNKHIKIGDPNLSKKWKKKQSDAIMNILKKGSSEEKESVMGKLTRTAKEKLEKGGPQMQSPMKDTKTPGSLDPMSDEQHKKAVPHDENNEHKPWEGGSPVGMKSPMKGEQKIVDGTEVHEGGHEAHHGEKRAIKRSSIEEKMKVQAKGKGMKMKSSGFKMKSGSPFQRNFGIGNTPSPMKRAEIELDGEVISAADYKKYKKKDKKLDRERFEGGHVEPEVYKEHFGDDFMTENEWTVSQNPGAYIEDGSVYIENEDGIHMAIGTDHTGYSDYMSTFDDKYEENKQKEWEDHRGGEFDLETSKPLEGSGITGAANINLTGSDFINDLTLQYQNYYGDKLKKGESIPSLSAWMKEMGGETENKYREALAFEEFKAEKGLSGEDALTAWRNREGLTDQ